MCLLGFSATVRAKAKSYERRGHEGPRRTLNPEVRTGDTERGNVGWTGFCWSSSATLETSNFIYSVWCRRNQGMIRCFQALNGTMRSEYQKNECGDIKESLLEEKGFVGPQLKTMVPNVI